MGGPHLEVRQPSRSTLISGDLVKDSLGSEAMRAVVYNAFHHRPEEFVGLYRGNHCRKSGADLQRGRHPGALPRAISHDGRTPSKLGGLLHSL